MAELGELITEGGWVPPAHPMLPPQHPNRNPQPPTGSIET